MRKNRIFLHSNIDNNLNTPTCLIDGRQAIYPTCNTSSRNVLTGSSKYEFNWCIWNSCTASTDSGGALKCTGANTQVYIESCSFISCYAKEKGGAIHTSSIHTLDAKHSFFHKCSTTTTSDNDGSGALWAVTIQKRISLSANAFISCTSKASSGAFCIHDCNSVTDGVDVIDSCRCIDCNATDTSPDAGAVWIGSSNKLIRLTSCLFSKCHAFTNDGNGGALRHTLSGYYPRSYPIRFCFFNQNTSPLGNDIYLPNFPSDAPCLHCFSLSASGRVGFYDGTVWDRADFNWLPHACD